MKRHFLYGKPDSIQKHISARLPDSFLMPATINCGAGYFGVWRITSLGVVEVADGGKFSVRCPGGFFHRPLCKPARHNASFADKSPQNIRDLALKNYPPGRPPSEVYPPNTEIARAALIVAIVHQKRILACICRFAINHNWPFAHAGSAGNSRRDINHPAN